MAAAAGVDAAPRCAPQGIYKPLEEASRKRGAEQAGGESESDEDDESLPAENSGSESGSGSESDGGSEPDPANHEATAGGNDATGDTDSEDEDAGGGDQVDQEALRQYELSKLRYYYAVVEADSAATAAHLYEECDGMEFMHSACKFDLRFVPDEQVTRGLGLSACFSGPRP